MKLWYQEIFGFKTRIQTASSPQIGAGRIFHSTRSLFVVSMPSHGFVWENMCRDTCESCVCQLKHSFRSSFQLLLWPHIQNMTWDPVLQWMYFTTSCMFSDFSVSFHKTHLFNALKTNPVCLTTILWNWSHIQLESLCIVQSWSVLFLAGWEGILRCVNRLANCAWPLTESVIACVLEYFAWRVGGSALEPALLRRCFKTLLHLCSIARGLAILSVTQRLITWSSRHINI